MGSSIALQHITMTLIIHLPLLFLDHVPEEKTGGMKWRGGSDDYASGSFSSALPYSQIAPLYFQFFFGKVNYFF